MSATGREQLAAAINREHAAAVSAARTAIERAVEGGRLLIQAKASMSHGAWLPWIDANLRFGDRQARKYMRLAEHVAGPPNRTFNSDLTIDGALALLAAPKKPREPHHVRAKTIEERGDWFARWPIDRRAWAIYLDADRWALADVAGFLGEPEPVARALIRPAADPGWHWELEASDPVASGRAMCPGGQARRGGMVGGPPRRERAQPAVSEDRCRHLQRVGSPGGGRAPPGR